MPQMAPMSWLFMPVFILTMLTILVCTTFYTTNLKHANLKPNKITMTKLYSTKW